MNEVSLEHQLKCVSDTADRLSTTVDFFADGVTESLRLLGYTPSGLVTPSQLIDTLQRIAQQRMKALNDAQATANVCQEKYRKLVKEIERTSDENR